MRSKYETPIKKFKSSFNKNNLFIKRDDLIPYSFGGNKARKAKYFFEEIKLQKKDCVVTYGSSSSNHCRVIANIAASKNLKCIIISPEESNKSTYNSKIMEILGAEMINCKIAEVKSTIETVLNKMRRKGFDPYFIEGGGHGNLGTKAYVEAYAEIKKYELEKNIYFDYIFHTSGTGTTQAGLVCGQIINEDERQIIGISNARKNPYGKQIVLDSANSYLESIEKNLIKIDAINFIDDYIIDGYGSYNHQIVDIIKDILIKEGIPLDTTYTGKGFWGMERYIKDKKIEGKNILFIHTGGTPLFFDDLEELNDKI